MNHRFPIVALVGTCAAFLTACSDNPTAGITQATESCYEAPTPSPRPPGALGLPSEQIPIDWPGTEGHGVRQVSGEDPLALVGFDSPLPSKTQFTVSVTVSAESVPEGEPSANATSWSDTTTVTTDKGFAVQWPTRGHDQGAHVAPGRYQAQLVLRSCGQTLVTADASLSVENVS